MKIARIRIQNFRSFKDETIYLNNYSCLVGPNGSGKSTILSALNILFRDTYSGSDNTVLQEEDFHCKNTSEPVRITVTFTDLNDDAKREFQHYFRQEELTVTACAIFDPATKTAGVKQFGSRMAMTDFSECFEDGVKATDIKTKYAALKEKYPDLPDETVGKNMVSALREYEKTHPGLCTPIESEAQFFGFTRGSNLLDQYVQWIYVPAVKDASNEQIESKNSALGRLLTRTVRASVNFDESLRTIKEDAQTKYLTLLDQNQSKLDDLSNSLQTKLREWSHPDVRLKLQWRCDAEKALNITPPLAETIAGEGAFDGAIKNFGHGLQRSYLLALLQELASINTEQSPTLILGCEEPELYQHPPQARHLASVFEKLTDNNSQIIVSTHSPYFVSGKGFEDVRYVRRDRSVHESKVQHLKYDDLIQAVTAARGEALPSGSTGAIAKIHQVLQPQVNEMFFTPTLILVEGLEDVAFITSYLLLMNLWDEFRRFGCHIVPVSGKSNLFKPIVIANKVCIPFFAVCDGDTDSPIANGRQEKHKKDNLTILNLCGISSPDPLPLANFWSDHLVMWTTNIGDMFKNDIDPVVYESTKNALHLVFNSEHDLPKNSLFIAELATKLWDAGQQSTNLKKLCNEMLRFARSVNGNSTSPSPGATLSIPPLVQSDSRNSQATPVVPSSSLLA